MFMEFEVYIYGNSVGRIQAHYSTRSQNYVMLWDKYARNAVKNLGVTNSCCASIFELLKGSHTYATFGDGVGELRVV